MRAGGDDVAARVRVHSSRPHQCVPQAVTMLDFNGLARSGSVHFMWYLLAGFAVACSTRRTGIVLLATKNRLGERWCVSTTERSAVRHDIHQEWQQRRASLAGRCIAAFLKHPSSHRCEQHVEPWFSCRAMRPATHLYVNSESVLFCRGSVFSG